MAASADVSGSSPVSGVSVRLLDGFRLLADGDEVLLPLAAQRVVAFLALHRRPLRRSYVAGCLWLDGSEARAAANLRTSLWRTSALERRTIRSSRTHIELGADVEVDVEQAARLAHCIAVDDLGSMDTVSGLLVGELLPDWYDDWVAVERERLRQIRLGALEQLSTALLAKGCVALAVEAALAAISAEPLRETAHRALIVAHIKVGNRGEAVRQYERYRLMLRESLNLDPSESLRAYLAAATRDGVADPRLPGHAGDRLLKPR